MTTTAATFPDFKQLYGVQMSLGNYTTGLDCLQGAVQHGYTAGKKSLRGYSINFELLPATFVERLSRLVKKL